MKKLIVGMFAALSVSSLWAETLGWYRFEEFERGAKPTDGTELVNSTPGGGSATLRVYDTSADKYIPVAALVGTNAQTTVNDLCPVADDRSLNFQQYGKKNGSAVVVPEWGVANGLGEYVPSSFTVESFFKLTGMAVNDGYRTFFAKTGTGTDGQTFRVYMVKADDAQADKLFVYLNDSQNKIDGVASTIRDGAWHHLAFAYDAERHVATVYFDYVAVLKKEVELNAYDAARALYVGSAGVYNTAGGGTSWNCFPGYVDEVRISDKALIADELLRFRPLGWKGDAVLDVSRASAILPDAVVTVDKSARVPGVRGGSRSYADSASVKAAWQGTDVFADNEYLKPEMAYKAGTTQGWTANTLWTYSGYIWNRNETEETWTFASCILARGSVWLDGQKVVANESPSSPDSWGGVKQGSVVVTPGAHQLEIRLHTTTVTQYTQGGGGAYYNASLANAHGTDAGYAWASLSGIMLDRQGRQSHDVADYSVIADTGDGDFLTQGNTPDVVTRSMPIAVETLVATGDVATVDFDGCDYALTSAVGYPTVVRCGTLTITESLTVDRGAYDGKAMSADGQVTFASGAKVVVDIGGRFHPAAGSVTILTAADGITGEPTLELAGAPRGTFSLRKSEDGKALYLDYVPNGLMLIFR